MRGADVLQEPMFLTVQLEQFVPVEHPLRVIRALMDEALGKLDGLFSALFQFAMLGWNLVRVRNILALNSRQGD